MLLARRRVATASRRSRSLNGSGRLNRHQGHDLQQVALDHVPERAGGIVVAGAAFQGEVLVKDDLHLFDVVPVPDRFQECVREAEAQDVEHRRLAQEVVHPVDVVLRDQRRQGLVEVAGGILTGPERLFHHQPRARRNVPRGQHFARLLADVGRKREVDGHRSLKAGQQGGELPARSHVKLVVSGCSGDPLELPLAGGVRLRVRIGEGRLHALKPLFLRPRIRAGAHEREPAGPPFGGQPGQSRQQQPAGEVPGRAKDEQGFYSCLAGHPASMPS